MFNVSISKKCLALLISLCLLYFQTGKAPYYVGGSQTLPRGMYSDRNKNVVGKFNAFVNLSLMFTYK